MTLRAFLAAATLLTPTLVMAEPPKVATDILPVHGLVAKVMDGVGAPSLILPPSASPHGYAMRPSEARALAEAGLIIWVGESLTPWLERAVENMAPDAVSVELLGVKGTKLLEFREGAGFEHDHDHGGHGAEHKDEHGHDEHAHDDKHDEHAHDDKHDEHAHDDKHDEHAHDDKHDHKHDEHAHDDKHDEHAHDDKHDDHGHAEGGTDPHAWLDTRNAQAWVAVIAEELTKLDPANAATYRANAEAATAELKELEATLAAKLAPLHDTPMFVTHDSLHYFEERFDLSVVGAISASDASAPGAARLDEVRSIIAEHPGACLLTEPQLPQALVRTVAEGSDTHLATVDILGGGTAPGAGHYAQMLHAVADNLLGCLH